MSPAGIGKGDVNTAIRRDKIKWIEKSQCSPAILDYVEDAESLIPYLNQCLFLGVNGFECHLSHYSPGAFYKKHVDNKKGGNRRVLTYISYLSPWEQGDGGELQLGDGLIIPPRIGQSILFDSATIEHEVLPCLKDRYALSGWFVR